MCVCACEGERAQLYIVAYWNLDFYLEWFWNRLSSMKSLKQPF
jgi:hypothetical protein